MASIGIHTNGSQFYIALAPMPQLNGRCVTFARIVKGMDSVAAMEKVCMHVSMSRAAHKHKK